MFDSFLDMLLVTRQKDAKQNCVKVMETFEKWRCPHSNPLWCHPMTPFSPKSFFPCDTPPRYHTPHTKYKIFQLMEDMLSLSQSCFRISSQSNAHTRDLFWFFGTQCFIVESTYGLTVVFIFRYFNIIWNYLNSM